jgi:ribosomal protein L16/L10AE
MEEKTTHATLFMLAALEKKNILFVIGNTFLLAMNGDGGIHMIKDDTLEMNISSERLEEMKATRIERVSIEKALKSVSSYKLEELKQLYCRIFPEKKMTKQKYYDSIKIE